MIKEKCVGSFKEAMEAQKLGANRIELCDNLEEGGTTPSYGTIKMTIKKLSIPAFIMIRPRGGDFYYSEEEIDIMKYDIMMCKSLKAKGVVFGVLNKDNSINYKVTKELVNLAKPMEITFHKAIDELKNPENEVEKLANIGIDRILSSGTKTTALNGANILNKMLEKGKGKIKIVVAGKVTKENLEEVSKIIPSTEFHGKKIV